MCYDKFTINYHFVDNPYGSLIVRVVCDSWYWPWVRWRLCKSKKARSKLRYSELE